MQKYIVGRLLLFFPTLVIASFVMFGIMRILPGDVALVIMGGDDRGSIIREDDLNRLRTQLGLAEPLYEQYGKGLWSMVSGTSEAGRL